MGNVALDYCQRSPAHGNTPVRKQPPPRTSEGKLTQMSDLGRFVYLRE